MEEGRGREGPREQKDPKIHRQIRLQRLHVGKDHIMDIKKIQEEFVFNDLGEDS